MASFLLLFIVPSPRLFFMNENVTFAETTRGYDETSMRNYFYEYKCEL